MLHKVAHRMIWRVYRSCWCVLFTSTSTCRIQWSWQNSTVAHCYWACWSPCILSAILFVRGCEEKWETKVLRRDPTLQDSFPNDGRSHSSGQISYYFFYLAFRQSQLERGRSKGLREQVVVRDERETKIPEGKQGDRGGWWFAGIFCSSQGVPEVFRDKRGRNDVGSVCAMI